MALKSQSTTEPKIRSYVRLLRPKQWIKNFFVLAPLIFARELFTPGPLINALKALICFCLAASSVYIVNDILDAEEDRSHPEKKNRPVAAGLISTGQAYALTAFLLLCAGGILLGTNLEFALVVTVYFLINLAYSIKLKEVVLLDVFIVAAGFMLRVLGGAYAIRVEVSSWIVLCTLFISLFLGFAKRRGEIVLTRESGSASPRKVLSLYNVSFIDQMLTITAAGAVISYALYTVAPRTLEMYGTDKMIYTTVFVLYGIFRYFYLIHMTSSTDNPTNAVTSDPTILTTGFLWIITCIGLIYFLGHY